MSLALGYDTTLCFPARGPSTLNFLPQYLHGFPNHLPKTQVDPNDHFISIWDDHKITLDHPWAIRALKGYAALVLIQRRLKFLLLRKRVLSLHPLVPAGSAVLSSIFSFLSPASVYPHPTLLITEVRGLLHAICQIRVVHHGSSFGRLPTHRYHYVETIDTFMMLNCFTRTYNDIISATSIPLPQVVHRLFPDFFYF